MKKIAILLCAAFAVAACDNFLDIKPKGSTIPEYYDDYAQLFNHHNISKAAPAYPVYLTDDVQLAGGSTLPLNLTAQSEYVRNLYMFSHGPVFPQGGADNFWDQAYTRLYTLNTVINHIMEVSDASEKDKLTLQAEARVARAYEYLSLVGAYAPAYDAATAGTDYGVPIVTTDDIDAVLDYRRNTVAEVYKFIEDDLTAALPHLRDVAVHAFKPDKTVSNGFLARMYLMQRDYARALGYAEQAVALNDRMVDLKLYRNHPNPNMNIGRIVSIADTDVLYPDEGNNPENIYIRYATYTFGVSKQVYASQDLLDTYNKDLPEGAVDLRRKLWFVDNRFFDLGNFPGYSLYVPGIKVNLGLNTVENMLTLAECYARRNASGDLSKAQLLYDRIRGNRIENYASVPFSDAADALEKILDERRREFAMTFYRLIDLKRLNKEEAFRKDIVHIADDTYTLPAGDNRYVLPLPPKVKSFRPDLPDYTR